MKKCELKVIADEFDEYYSNFDPYTDALLNALEKIYAENATISSYELKAKNIAYLCDNCPIHIFRTAPFFFEFSSGRTRHTWGGLQSPAGSFLHEKKADEWLNKYADELKSDRENGYIYCWNNPVGFDHFSLGYDRILNDGFEKIISAAEQKLLETEDKKKRAFLSASISSMKSLLRLAERFSKEAMRIAESAKNEEEKLYYKRIAETAEQVPAKPPRDFFEALSSIVFCREAIGSLEGIGISTYGHIDRLLGEFCDNDIKSGKLTFEKVQNYFDILLTYTDTRFEVRKGFFETSTTMVIGGCCENGNVCFNTVTKALLKAVRKNAYVNTKINCRVSSRHPREFFEMLADIQTANIPILAIQNDDVIIPARVKCGEEENDARLYVSGGCHEIVLQNTEVNTRADTWINLSRILLDVLDFCKAENFDAFYNETLASIKKYIFKIMEMKNHYERSWCEIDPLPLYSSTMTGCLENALDATNGGTKYASTSLSLVGAATLTDSLYAIKTLVYEQKKFDLKRFSTLCKNNYSDNESLRQYIINRIPKYGTGNREVDLFAAELLHNISMIYRDKDGNLFKNGRDGNYLPAFYPHEIFRTLGYKTAATPDGRRAFSPLSRGCSPSEFIEVRSPLDILKSISEIDFTDYADSFCTEITLQRMSPDIGIPTITVLIETFIANGGSSLQFNLLDSEKLIEAQKDPDKHRDICVRVCGYSAVFVTLDKEQQAEIISRAIR